MVITSSPHTLSVVFGIRVGGSEEASLTIRRLRRRVWQGEAPSEPEATLKPSATDKGGPCVS